MESQDRFQNEIANVASVLFTRVCFFLQTGIFIFLSFSIRAQQGTMVQQDDGVNSIILQAGSKIVSTLPVSSPTLLSVSGSNTTPSGISNARDLNWVLKFSATNKVFKDISFGNPLVGYIVTELGSVYKSIDGGDSWVSVMNLGFPYYWYGVHALSPDTVVISGFNNQAPITQGVVRWSLDGGSTWGSDINLGIPVSGVGWLERVHFFNKDTGVVFNSFSGGCWYTTTGGKDSASWTYVVINQDGGWIAGNVDAQSSGQLYATGIHFAHSTNFGADWVSLPSADSVFDGGIDFLDFNNSYGWTGGGQISAPVAGWVRRTVDSGQTWSPRLNTFPYPIRAVRFFNQTTGLAVGGNLYDEAGGIYSTTDGGISWNLDVSTAAEMFSIESKMVSADSMDVWCVGSTGGGTGFTGKLYKARTGNLFTGLQNTNSGIPDMFELYQNYPNPFDESTVIAFTIPVSCYTSLKVYDVLGKEVATLVDGVEMAGYKSVHFAVGDLGTGMYYYRLQAAGYLETKKLLLRR